MSHPRPALQLLGLAALLLAGTGPALAADYSGTLDFASATPTAVTFQGPFGPIAGNVGVDADRYFLGDTLGGNTLDIRFTTHGTYNGQGTVLALLFATDPNDAILNDPSSLASFVNPATDVQAFLDAHVIGWQYFVFGNVVVSNGTTDVSGFFNPPMNFTAGVPYYAFVAGGSAYAGNTITDAGIGYTLSVNAVPEPMSWAMLVAGLGLLAGIGRRLS